MRIAIISDIHGNFAALKSTFECIRRESVDLTIFLGDLFGYYSQTVQCLELLLKNKTLCVAGNHDLMAKKSSHENFQNIPSWVWNEIMTWPEEGRIETEFGNILFHHSSPNNDGRYIYPTTFPSDPSFNDKVGCKYLLLGHTHHQMVRFYDSFTLINPGSIGQPRDIYGPHSSWALLDCEQRLIRLKRSEYPLTDFLSANSKMFVEKPTNFKYFFRKL